MPKRGGSKGKKKPSLHSLSREALTQAQVTAFFDELTMADDRTSALVGVAAIDQALVHLIRLPFPPMMIEHG
jgi:hypothetical protein